MSASTMAMILNPTQVTVTYSVSATPGIGAVSVRGTVNGQLVASTLALTSGSPPTYTVVVTPDVQALAVPHNTSQSAPFTVRNAGNSTATYTITTSCSGTGVTCTGVAPGSLTLAPGQSGNATLSFTAGAAGTSGLAGISAAFGAATDNGSYAVTSHVFGVTVVPVTSALVTPASTTRSTSYTVTNISDTTIAFSMSVSCASPSLASCSVASPLTLGAGLAATVPVTYTTSATNGVSGPLSLTATSASATATGTTTVSTPTPIPSAVVASVSTVNAGEQVARDLCLTVAAGNDAAYECGDLRLVHPFATARTKNKARTPTLLYTSQHAQPFALVAAAVTIPDNSAIPDSVIVDMALTDGSGRHPATGKWGATSQWRPGVTRRLVVGFDAASYPSGIYPYTLTLMSYFGAVTKSTAVSGTLLLVNRKTSAFGAGWWLAGLEQLTPINSDLLWVGGDGSARVYHAVVSGAKWAAAAVDRPDTITFSAGTYTRFAEHGVLVQFNSAGQHVSTINRLGDITTFVYTSGRLTSITVPPAAAAVHYAFTYANPNTTLSSVTLTAGTGTRTTNIANATGTTISGFTDPDATTIGFTYISGTARVQTRTDRRLNATTYSYDAGGKLSQDSVAMASPAPPLVTKFRALESWGLPGLPAAPADSTNIYSLIDGPRTDVGDSTRLYLDRFGAPQRIFNALGDSTVLTRANNTFPALVTQLRRPNGFTSTAIYDPRGNLQTSTDLAPLGPFSANVVTSFKWIAPWDFVTRIDRSAGLPSDTMFYDAHGNRLWQQAGPDATRRVTFTYDPALLLVASVQTALQASLGSTVAQRVAYNATTGNIASLTSPSGLVDYFYSDVYGRDTLVKSPLDLAQTIFRQDSTTYDAADRPIRAVSFGPARNGQAPKRTVVVTGYDAEGNVVVTRRTALPDVALIGTLRDSAVYDFAHRKVKAIAVDSVAENMVYDPAGNVVSTTTRRGQQIAMSYDVLNRLARRVTGSVAYSKVTEFGLARTFPLYSNVNGGGLTLPSDTAVFAYDAAGHMLRADNNAALVRRGYLPGGLIAADTQVVRTYVTDPTVWGDTVQHQYVLAYDYDDAGRRALLRHPSQFDTGRRYTTGYGYDPVMGQLQQITDPLGNVFTLTEDADRRPVRTQYPGGERDTTMYDLEGYVAELKTLNTATRGQYFDTLSTLYDAVLTRETQGRVTHATFQGLAAAPPSDMSYGGLGELVSSIATNGFLVHDQLSGTNTPGSAYSNDGFTLDALGNQVTNVRTTSTDVGNPINYHELPFTSTTTYGYDSLGSALGRGRLRQRTVPANTEGEVFRYDSAGNVTRDSIQTNTSFAITHSYYDVLNKLRVVDRQVYEPGNPSNRTSSYDEYAYDALGRRVLVRSRVLCMPWPANEGRCWSKVRRTIWDGADELWEIQNHGDNLSTLENDTPTSTALPLRLWGQVLYVHGTAIDQPLGIIRFAYQDSNSTTEPRYVPGPFLTVPHYTWRGAVLFATYADGSERLCATGSQLNCVQSGWAPMEAYQGRRFATAWPEWSWLGTSLEGKTDAAGLQYKRNRYYDPTTGRFTQEDPIGLGGGLNAYGFANGDPINFADPFGLCPPQDQDASTCPSSMQAAVRLGQMAPAINQATVAFAGLSVAGGVAGAAVATGEGASAVGLGLSRIPVGRALLPVVASAIGKLENLAEKFDMSPTEIANKAISVGEQMIDHLNGGNINNLLQRPDGVSGFIRVTTDPNAQKIISAGLQSAKMVENGIANGRFTPIQ